MEDSRKASLRPLVQSWTQARLQILQDHMLRAWKEGLAGMEPGDELLGKLLEAAGPEAGQEAFPESEVDTDHDLGHALDLLEGSASQGEVLKNLLDGLQPFVERSALFVIKQTGPALFAHRGFDSDHPRLGAAVAAPPELEALLSGQVAGLPKPGPAYVALLDVLSRFEASDARILPLRLRRKPVALLLVDSGIRQRIDHPHHVRALVRAAEAALAFQVGLKEEERTAHGQPEAPHSVETQRLPEPAAEPSVPALDPKVRANAERSARVLVGDLELYFPGKVAQGGLQKNLYAVLRDELDRSRASFVDRYGLEMEEQHRIFQHTVIQQLCGGDASILGPAPWKG